MKFKRLWLTGLLLGLLFQPVPVQARDTEGSLTIRLTEDAPAEGVRFELDKCAEIVDGLYVLQEPYAQSGVDINRIESALEMEEAAGKLAEIEAQDPVEVRTDSEGMARTELEAGVWLVRMTDGADYGWIAPFMTAVPSWDLQDGQMTWNTVTEPKRIPFPQLRIRKVDEKGQAVTGLDFTFEMTRDGKTVTGQTDPETGTVTFPLSWGEAVIRETEAPAGYQLSERTIQVVTDSGVQVDGTPAQPEQGMIEISYMNRRLTQPSQTPPTAAWSAAGFWSVAAGGAVLVLLVLRKLKKQKKSRNS